MPRTRGQLAALKDKHYFIIPDKKDLSLFQKSSQCIEGLPLTVFMMIQQYLSEKEYRNLMNCNLATFQPIKYETVKYSLIPSNEWEDIDSCADENKFEFVERLVNSVRDKSKQISMQFTKDQEELLKYREIISGIREIFVSGACRSFNSPYPFTNEMDFSMFNGITSVKLHRLDGITRIDSGLENIEHLEISTIYELVELKPLRDMKTVSIKSCSRLATIRLENVDIIDICGSFASQLPNCEIFGSPSSVKVAVRLLTPINIKNFALDRLEFLSLHASFAQDYDFQSLFHISHLELQNSADRIGEYNRPSPPLGFTGKKLKLKGFNLSSWLNQNFPNIISLGIIDCVGLSLFPEMLQLKELILNSVHNMQSIPSCLKLETMKIGYCKELLRVSEYFPILNECTITNCNQLHDISGLSTANTVSLSNCTALVSVEVLSNVPNVTINSCRAVRFDGFDQTQIAFQRMVQLQLIYSNQHLSGIGNIAKLIMKDCEIVTGGGIHDIEDLTIERCHVMKDTSNFINITNSLTILTCHRLERLDGLIGIPYVYIEQLAYSGNIKDVSGLGNHQKLTIPSFPFFENLLEKYLLVDEMEEYSEDEEKDGKEMNVKDQQQSVEEVEERKRLEDFFGGINNLVIRRPPKNRYTLRDVVLW